MASSLANLPQKPLVLLLEAGGSNLEEDARLLALRFSTWLKFPQFNWQYKTTPQSAFGDRELVYPRGKGLGGSTAINFCNWTIGPRDEYDFWAAKVKDDAFDFEHAEQRFDGIAGFRQPTKEQQRIIDVESHAEDGPVKVQYPTTFEKGFLKLFDALLELEDLPLDKDLNSGDPIGFSVCPTTSQSSKRISSANAYLQDIPDNLHIMIDSQVYKVLIEDDRATGVSTKHCAYYCSKDVILSAGAIDTPKLLMLSGIGPKPHLTMHAIPCIQDLPVGIGLQDRPLSQITYKMKPGTFDRAKTFGDPENLQIATEQFKKDGTGPLASLYNSLQMAWLKGSDELYESKEFKELPAEVQDRLRASTVPLRELALWGPTGNPEEDPKSDYLTMTFFLHSVMSRGTVQLASANPELPPLIDLNMLSDPFDRGNFIETAQLAYRIMESPQITSNFEIEGWFDAPVSCRPADIWEYLKKTTEAAWHASGSVKMGTPDDPEACVTSDFRVKGVDGLRVVDNSVTPFLMSCHTQSIAYFVGATAAEKIVREYYGS